MDKIYLTASRGKDVKFECTSRVLKILGECGIKVYCDEKISSAPKFKGKVTTYNGQSSDAVICIGGDGTIMRAAGTAVLCDIPILGINLGHVGYLAELEPNEINMLKQLKNDAYFIEERMLLNVKYPNGDTFALNDAVVTNDKRSQIATVTLFCDGNRVSTYRADGLILSTPTGSTAYNLSAGGPIIDPKLSCIVSTPIAPHSLKAKPLIFDQSSVLKIESAESGKNGKFSVCVDGRYVYSLAPKEFFEVKKSDKKVKFLRLKKGKNAFYDILDNKMKD